MIIPRLFIRGADVSRFLLSCHAEMTANQDKDPGKFDIKLANISGRFFGAFAAAGEESDEDVPLTPKTKILFLIINRRQNCESSVDENIRIFTGEVQNANCDEVVCNISGSCSEGGMTSGLKQHKAYEPGWTIREIANNLLDEYGIDKSKRVIEPQNNVAPDKTPEYWLAIDFDTAFSELSDESQSIYFFDEHDVFHLVSPFHYKGSVDLTGSILRGSDASTMVGHCNKVNVFGGSPGPMPSDPGSEIKTHWLIHAEAKNEDEIAEYGEMVAPPVYVPNCPYEECQRIADNLLAQYMQYKDVPQIKVVGRAPPLLRRVTYHPYNGNLPPTNCSSNTNVQVGTITGLVTRRVVDLDANSGFVCTLDVATNSLALEDAGIDIPEGESI
jgi:hypothetical protein